MMNEQPDPLSGGDHDDAVDRRIRQLLSGRPDMEFPLEIISPVRSRIRRRRNVSRAIAGGLAVAAVTVAGLLTHWHPVQQSQTTLIASAKDVRSENDTGSGSLDDIDLAPLMTAPPVVAFRVVSQHQLGLLATLKSVLKE